ncbi:unnamed protein product [Mortierella alpina]
MTSTSCDSSFLRVAERRWHEAVIPPLPCLERAELQCLRGANAEQREQLHPEAVEEYGLHLLSVDAPCDTSGQKLAPSCPQTQTLCSPANRFGAIARSSSNLSQDANNYANFGLWHPFLSDFQSEHTYKFSDPSPQKSLPPAMDFVDATRNTFQSHASPSSLEQSFLQEPRRTWELLNSTEDRSHRLLPLDASSPPRRLCNPLRSYDGTLFGAIAQMTGSESVNSDQSLGAERPLDWPCLRRSPTHRRKSFKTPIETASDSTLPLPACSNRRHHHHFLDYQQMSARMMSRDSDSDHGSPAPRIRVGYTRGSEGFDNPRGNGHPQPRLSFHEPQLHHQQQQQQHHQLHQLQQQHQQQQLPSSNVSIIGRDHVLVEIDHQLNSVAELLAEIVLLPQDSPVDPALFLAVGCLELYDQDQRHCVQSLREERKRLMERRQAIEIELMRQDTAEIELRAEEKRIHSLELATETMAIPPESLVPLSKSRTKLLDDLGNILSKIRTLLETVHIQYEVDQGQLVLRQQQQQPQQRKGSGQREDKPQAGVEEEEEEVGGGEGGGKMEIEELEGLGDGVTLVNMTMFQRHGLMDLYDRNPVKCTSLLRVEHARLAERRDELELEYERQRTALLRAMPRG